MMSRLVQILLAMTIGLLVAPFAAVTAIAVWATLGRPLTFRQRRSGRYGRPFVLLKFRTMHAPGRGPDDSDLGRTPLVGTWLRRLRLDELPQLLNIVRGEMNFIGPRPLLPETIAAFGEAGVRRGMVRPGLTGWSQVCGNTMLTDQEKLALDLWYIAHRSPRHDAMLIVRTLAVIIFGERANIAELERAHAGSRHRGG